MIQRAQSIFLFFVGICMGVSVFTGFWHESSSDSKQKVELTAISLEQQTMSAAGAPVTTSSTTTIYIALLAAGVLVVAYYSIFQYKNRLLQIKLGALNSLLMTAMLGVVMYLSYNAEKIVDPLNNGKYEIGLFSLIIAIILNMLSNRFIRRDEKLVRSADRLR